MMMTPNPKTPPVGAECPEWEAREMQRKSIGRVTCGCGKSLSLWAETEEWTQTRTGLWRHSGYGPGTGECERCGIVYCDDPWNGLMSFRLPKS